MSAKNSAAQVTVQLQETKVRVNNLNCMKNEIDLWYHGVSALIDDPKKKHITQEEVEAVSNRILKFLWMKKLISHEDIHTVTKIEPATPPKRGCPHNTIRQTPTSSLINHEDIHTVTKIESATPPKRGCPQNTIRPTPPSSVFDDVKATLQLEDEEIHFQGVCDECENFKLKAGRYKAERNVAVVDNEDLKKQVHGYRQRENDLKTDLEYLKHKLAELESDVQHKDQELLSLKNIIEGQSHLIQELQKRAEEDKQDAHDAIVHYKEEEQRYKKARNRANDKIIALKKEKDEIFAKFNKITIDKIEKLKAKKDEAMSMLQKQKSVNEAERQRHKKHEDNLSEELQTLHIELENEKSKNSQRDKEDIRREERSNTKLCDENDELKMEILDMQKSYSLEEHQKETLDKKNEEIVLLTRKRYELEEELKFSNERKSVIEMAYEEMKMKYQNMTQRLQESENRSKFSGTKGLSDIEKENESLSTEVTMSLKTIENLKQDYRILEKKIKIERFQYKDTLTQMRAELSNRKSHDVDQRETFRTLDEEKQNLTSKIYSLENENVELNERIEKAETGMMQMQMIMEENDHLKRSLSDMRAEVKDVEARYKSQYKAEEDTIKILKDENDRLRKEGNFAKKETDRVTREKDTLAKEFQTEINTAKTEHDKLRREKNELIILFKEESKKDKDKINKLEQESQLFNTRYKQEADTVGIGGTNTRLKIENERLRNERNSARTDLQQKAKDNEVLKSENQTLKDEWEQLKKKKVELVSTFQVESEKHKHHTEKLEREMEVLRERDMESKYQHCMKCDEYERKLNRHKKDYQELQDRYNIASTDIHLANKKLEELSNVVENGKMETARVTEYLEKAIQEKSNLERQLRDLESQYQHCMKCDEYERKLNKLKKDHQELQDRCQHKDKVQQEADIDKIKLQGRISMLEIKMTELKQDKGTLNSRIEVLKEEKSDLEERIRLQDAAGFNPNMTELSDANRPTALAEKFGSLYTDEYTNAMEVIEDDMDEKAVVDLMLQWLKGCYDWCAKLAEEQRHFLNTESIGFMQKYGGRRIGLALPDKHHTLVKEFQRKIAADTTSPVGQICIEKAVKKKKFAKDNRIIKYLEKCSDLCWKMQIKDPPMYLNFDIQKGENLDKNNYNVFTKSGNTIDFLVWPVLKLHKDGPMLAKGVAQGK